jgi:1L-myo-inositol 1-phosphate cytidylyltransferase
MMADHIFDPAIVDSLCELSLEEGEVVLAVDRKIDSIYDLDDATKVLLQGERIVEIDKQLEHYNAIDTGLFICSPALVVTLTELAEQGDCSLSDGMRRIAAAGNLRYLDIGASWWQDVDTPGALEHAEQLLASHLPDTPADDVR